MGKLLFHVFALCTLAATVACTSTKRQDRPDDHPAATPLDPALLSAAQAAVRDRRMEDLRRIRETDLPVFTAAVETEYCQAEARLWMETVRSQTKLSDVIHYLKLTDVKKGLLSYYCAASPFEANADAVGTELVRLAMDEAITAKRCADVIIVSAQVRIAIEDTKRTLPEKHLRRLQSIDTDVLGPKSSDLCNR